MITQAYKQLWLTGFQGEASPAILVQGFNAVQLTAVVYHADASASMWVEGSNDAENWRMLGSATVLGAAAGFYVGSAANGVCTRYVRVACSLADDASVLLAVTVCGWSL